MDVHRSNSSKGPDEDNTSERKEDGKSPAASRALKRPATTQLDSSESGTSGADAAVAAVQESSNDDDLDDPDNTISADKLATMNRIERKRYRERKRRSDVNKGFDDLMTLLLEIDPEVRSEAEERGRRGQWKGNMGAQEDNLLSRVDLISRTVNVLQRLHQENEEHKVIIGQLLQRHSSQGAARGASLHQHSQEGTMGILRQQMMHGTNADEFLASRVLAQHRSIFSEDAIRQFAAQQQREQLLQTQALTRAASMSDAAGSQFNPLLSLQNAHASDLALLQRLAATSNLSSGASFAGLPMASFGSEHQLGQANISRNYLQQLLHDQQQQQANAEILVQLQQRQRSNSYSNPPGSPDGAKR